jgi:glutathione S-transferase
MILYSMQDSANSYKARMVLAWLRLPFEIVEIDILAGENRTPDYLALNAAGQVPVLVLDDGRLLPESGAILYFLAQGSDLLPSEGFARAEVLRWMFFEQHSHGPFIGSARFWLGLVRGGRALKQNLIEEWEDRGYEALGVMESHLRAHPFFAGEQPTIADIALYANTHRADEGGFDLGSFPAVSAWVRRIGGHPSAVGIDWRPPAGPRRAASGG